MTDNPIPVVVLTGFLGSGKTTVLRHLARMGELQRTLVLINEFGEVGLDHELLMPLTEDSLVAIDSGCICCTIRADLAETLIAAPGRYARNGVRWFDRIIVETTGIADPAPILQTILAEPSIVRRYALAGVVTTIDAVNGVETIQSHPEAYKQVAVADRILLTKADLATQSQTDVVRRLVRQISPSVPVSLTLNGTVRFEDLVAGGGYSFDDKSPDVEAWLLAERQADVVDDGHSHRSHKDVNRHGGIHASCLTFTEPVDPIVFDACLHSLMSFRGADLLRVKGIVNVMGMPKPMVIHGVQHVFHPPQVLERWPGPDRRTRIVLITRHLDHEDLRACFAGLGLAVEASPI